MSQPRTTRSLVRPPPPPKPPLGQRRTPRPTYPSSHTPITIRPVIVPVSNVASSRATHAPPNSSAPLPPVAAKARAWPLVLFVVTVFVSGAAASTLVQRARAAVAATQASEPPVVTAIAFPPPPVATPTQPQSPPPVAVPALTVAAPAISAPASRPRIRPKVVPKKDSPPEKAEQKPEKAEKPEAEPVDPDSLFSERK